MFILSKPIWFIYRVWAVIVFCCVAYCFMLIWIVVHIFLPSATKSVWTWWIARIIVTVFFLLVGIWVKNIFLEKEVVKQSSKQPVIYIANHCSYVDVPTLYACRILPFVFLAKKAYASIPLFGYFYRKASVNVARAQRKSRSSTIEQLQDTLRKKRNIFIFPEGTFNESADLFTPFHIGAFSLAIKTNTPISPLLLIDTRKRMPPSSPYGLTPGVNRIMHLPVIDIHLHQTISSVKLMKHTESVMRSAWCNFL